MWVLWPRAHMSTGRTLTSGLTWSLMVPKWFLVVPDGPHLVPDSPHMVPGGYWWSPHTPTSFYVPSTSAQIVHFCKAKSYLEHWCHKLPSRPSGLLEPLRPPESYYILLRPAGRQLHSTSARRMQTDQPLAAQGLLWHAHGHDEDVLRPSHHLFKPFSGVELNTINNR